MLRRFLRSKIHRATVTGVDLDYVGSLSLDPDLMAAAGIHEWEQVHVLDITNGVRLITYAMDGGPGEVRINGAAARLVSAGDLIIVLTYADYGEQEIGHVRPTVVHVDERNAVIPSPDPSSGGSRLEG